eukprot:4679545-Prymnesium_polylepis.1
MERVVCKEPAARTKKGAADTSCETGASERGCRRASTDWHRLARRAGKLEAGGRSEGVKGQIVVRQGVARQRSREEGILVEKAENSRRRETVGPRRTGVG